MERLWEVRWRRRGEDERESGWSELGERISAIRGGGK